MANIVSTSESRTFDTVLAAFSGKWLKGQPVEQSQQRNNVLTLLKRKQKPGVGGRMYFNVSTVTTETGEGAFVKASELTPKDVDDTTTGYHDIAFYRTKVTVFYTDLIKTGGGMAFFDLVAHKLKMARQRHLNEMHDDLWATTAVSNGLQGIPIAVADTPTSGTYGGLNSATQTWWRNEYDNTGYTISTGLMGALDAMDYTIGVHGEWTVAVTSSTVHRILRELHRDYAQINLTPSTPMGKKAADLGFSVIEYDGKPILWDRSCPSTSSTTGHRLYTLNLDKMYLGVVPGWDMRMTPWKELESQEGKTATIISAVQLITDERRSHGVITGLDV